MGLTTCLFRGILYTLLLWTGKVIGHFEWDLVDHPSRSIKNSGGDSDLNYGDTTQQFSEKKNVHMWLRDHSCDLLTKNRAVSCPHTKISS
jgi:hypothetical protein